MRFFYSLLNDIRYQITYGFYFLYAFMTILYICILYFVPLQYKQIIAIIILLSDPAALGFFFIGGIWLLEKSEGIHMFYSISPLKSIEYIVAKTFSLSFISVIAGCIIVIVSVQQNINMLIFIVSMILGSSFFTIFGLYIATYAHSVNQYMIKALMPGTLLIMPALVKLFGITHPILDLFPSTMLMHLIRFSITKQSHSLIYIIGLLLWLVVMLIITTKRISLVLESGVSNNESNA